VDAQHKIRTYYLDPMPVVLNLQQFEPASFGGDRDGRSTCVEAVFKHFLQGRSWAVDYLASCDAIYDRLIQLLNRRNYCASAHFSKDRASRWRMLYEARRRI
jgi:hypothetical protein